MPWSWTSLKIIPYPYYFIFIIFRQLSMASFCSHLISKHTTSLQRQSNVHNVVKMTILYIYTSLWRCDMDICCLDVVYGGLTLFPTTYSRLYSNIHSVHNIKFALSECQSNVFCSPNGRQFRILDNFIL